MVNDDEGWSMVIHSDLGISIVMGGTPNGWFLMQKKYIDG